MIDNEANPSGIIHEFRVRPVKHRNGQIRILESYSNLSALLLRKGVARPTTPRSG